MSRVVRSAGGTLSASTRGVIQVSFAHGETRALESVLWPLLPDS